MLQGKNCVLGRDSSFLKLNREHECDLMMEQGGLKNKRVESGEKDHKRASH